MWLIDEKQSAFIIITLAISSIFLKNFLGVTDITCADRLHSGLCQKLLHLTINLLGFATSAYSLEGPSKTIVLNSSP